MNPDGTCETVLLPNVPDSVAWQPLAGKPAEPALVCADLKVSADTPEVDLPLHGQSTYTLTVLNQGNETGSAVTLDQPAPGDVSLVASNPSQGTCTSTNGIHCDLGALAPGATVTVAVNVKAGGRPGNTTLSAHVFAPEPDGDPFDNDARPGVSVFPCTILGTAGPDTLYGTPGRDTICGRFGNDTIYGGAGNDVIYGGEGADLIYGGKGRDTIYGGGGNDVILARDGERDVIDCGPEKDTAVVDRIDVVSHCRTVYRPHKPKPRRQARAPR
jgi:Ca2+-binding RTX toxin-like protein